MAAITARILNTNDRFNDSNKHFLGATKFWNIHGSGDKIWKYCEEILKTTILFSHANWCRFDIFGLITYMYI